MEEKRRGKKTITKIRGKADETKNGRNVEKIRPAPGSALYVHSPSLRPFLSSFAHLPISPGLPSIRDSFLFTS